MGAAIFKSSTGNLPAIEPGHTLNSASSSYSVLEFIGQGTFGKVAKCKKLSTKETVAVKILKILPEAVVDYEIERSNLEIMSLLNADTTNIVKFYEGFDHMGWTCMAFEMLDINLNEVLRDRKFKPLNLREIRPIAKQLLCALDALKGIGMLHADIKPNNIMVVNKQEWPPRVKLIDFGVGLRAREAQPGLARQIAPYRAPEIFLGLPFTEAIDTWAIGCVLAYLFLGVNLFQGRCYYHALKQVVHLLGLPEDRHLRAGMYTRRFFTEEETAEGPAWRLLTPQEYMDVTGKEPQEPRRIIRLPRSLDNLVNGFTERGTEPEDSSAFLDLLKGLLHLDGDERITPCQALQLPYITMSHLQGLPNSREYVTAAKAMMSLWPSKEETPPLLDNDDPEPRILDGEIPPHPDDEDQEPQAVDGQLSPHPDDEDQEPQTVDGQIPPHPDDEDQEPQAVDGEIPPHPDDEDQEPQTVDGEIPPHPDDEDQEPQTVDGEIPPHPDDEDQEPQTVDGQLPPHPDDEDQEPQTVDGQLPPHPDDEDQVPQTVDGEIPPHPDDEDQEPQTVDGEIPPHPDDEDQEPQTVDGEIPPHTDDEDQEPQTVDGEIPPHPDDEDQEPQTVDGEIPPHTDDEDQEPQTVDGEIPPHPDDEDQEPQTVDGEIPPHPDEKDADSQASFVEIPPYFYNENLTSSVSDRAHTPLSNWEHPEVRPCDGEHINVSLNASETAQDNAGDLPPRSSAEESSSWAFVETPCSRDEPSSALPEPEAPKAAAPASSGRTSKRLKRIRKFFGRIAKAFRCSCRTED